MNRTIRAISLALLLALVLSVFGIFASFAEEATTPAQEYGKLMYDFDAVNEKDLGGTKANATLTKKEAADGSPYWSYNIPGADQTAGDGGGDYLGFSAWQENINISTGLDANGNPVTDPDKQKNTDFLVVDFDVSTDTTFIDGLYFHTCFYDNSYSHGNRVSNGNVYFDLDAAYNDALSIGLYGSKNTSKAYAYNTYSGEKWTDVTFVYDFRDTSKTVVYFYLNGIYAGKTGEINLATKGVKKYATRLYFFRLTTPVQSLYDTNTNFANFTVKKFDVGYDGPFTDTNFGLGKTGATLDTMPDLAYCLEDKPEESLTKLATVTHSDGKSYDAYEFDELDANLVDGDVVTLYKNVPYPLIVPEGANITFKDEAGNILTPGTRNSADLVGLVELRPLDYSAGSFVTRDRKTMKTVTQLTDTNFATAFDAAGKGSVIYTLLADTEATFETEGASDVYPIIDLNSHTLTLGATTRAFLHTVNNFVRIANGKFIFIGGGNDFTTLGKAGALIFENLDLFLTKTNGAIFIDQRGGTVVFKDIKSIEREPIYSEKKYVGAMLSSAKSTYSYNSRVIVDGCTFNTEADASLVPAGKTVTSSPVFSTSNLNSGGVRYAGQNVKLTFTDVVANLGRDPFLELNANTHTEGTATTFKNDETKLHELVSFEVSQTATENNVHNTEIVFSNVEATSKSHLIGSALIRYDRKTDAVKEGNVTTHKAVTYEVLNTKMNVNIDVKLDNCDISSTSLLYCTNGITFYDPAVNTDYDYSCDYKVNVTGETDLNMSSGVLVNEKTSLDYEALDINLDGEILLPESFTNKDSRFTYSVAAPAIFVPRNEGYAVTVDKVQSYPYILGDHEYEFYWFAGETVSTNKIPVELPAASKYFSYSWAGPNDDGAYYAVVTDTIPVKANVSLYSDFILNIYLPTDLGDDCYKSLTLDGADTQVTLVVLDGVEYMKVSIADINPATAADATELAFEVKDGSFETTVVKSVSVVDYLKSALNNASSDTEATLIVSMINYVEKAYQYVTPDGEELPESLTELTSSAKYTSYTIDKLTNVTATQTVADLGVFESVYLSLNNAFRFTFKTDADFEGNLVFSYVKNGRLFVETKRCVGGREITLELKANELLQNITVSYGDKVGEYNLAAYFEWTKTTENAELVSLVEALWLYADYAKAYVAAVNP